jgi:hypothetical protein
LKGQFDLMLLYAYSNKYALYLKSIW